MIKKSWWIDFRFNHSRYRRRSPDNSRAGALAYEAVLRQKLARGESIDLVDDPPQQSQTFQEFAKEWFKQYVVANNRYSEQYEKWKILTTSLMPFFGSMPLYAIKTHHIEQYKAGQVSNRRREQDDKQQAGGIGQMPAVRSRVVWHSNAAIKMLRCAPPKTDYLTVAECELLLSHSRGQLREMILLALRTGMRQGEIRGLQWSSIDWQNRSLAVRHSLCTHKKALVAPKSNRERHIPLDADVYEVLFRRKRDAGYVFINENSGAPFTTQRLMEVLSKVCRKAQMRKIGWHAFRHTFATQLRSGAFRSRS